MKIADNSSDMERWALFNASHRRGHFMQSPEWAAVKSNWKNEVVLAEAPDGELTGGMSLLIRRVPLFGALVYCPRGPVCDDDPQTLEQLTLGAGEIMRKYRAVGVRLEPDVRETEEAWRGYMAALGWKFRRPLSARDLIQPRSLFRLDLRGKNEDELMAGFHKKLRYNIRLAQRHGIEIVEGGVGALGNFCRLLDVTAKRDGFVTRNIEYFRRLWDCLGTERVELLLAKRCGVTLAGGLFIKDCGKTWYAYGASSDEHRNLMPCHLLHWEAIRRALGRGDTVYDLRGYLETADNSSGLYRFKKQFGAEPVFLMGEVYLTDRPARYRLYRLTERLYRSGVHLYSKIRKR